MTLNILFLTITISKRKINLKKVVQQEQIEKLKAEYKDQRFFMRHF